MNFLPTEIDGVFVLQSGYKGDNRGYFERLFCVEEFGSIGLEKNIAQINRSYNALKGTVRGLHFQTPPKTEVKIVKCLKGRILDYIVDIRANSLTFLKHITFDLNGKENKYLYLPLGVAHGYQVLEDHTEILYFHSEFYSKEYESGLNFLDPKLNIQFPISTTDMSERDKSFKMLDENFKGIYI